MKFITIREIHENTGIAVSTLSKWCRAGILPAEKIMSPAGEYWQISTEVWEKFEKNLKEVKRGRPKKE